MNQKSSSPAGVRVTAPARLHLGFLDLNGSLGRRFGSIGLAVDKPETRILITRTQDFSAAGPDSDRALKLLQKYTVARATSAYSAVVEEAIPAHAGLGSGTQLALAIGAGTAHLEGHALTAYGLTQLGERGARSGIGLAAFTGGGFLVDGGKGERDTAPPLTVRAEFPSDWRVLMILDQMRAGVSGEAETQAFKALPPFPDSAAAHICRLVLMKLIPGVKEADLPAFGSAISEIQEIVGGHFANAQGGSPWSSAAVGRLATRMRDKGATGIGQSSWGPSGFAFVASLEAAERLYHSLVEEAKANGLEIIIAQGRNSGARIGPA